MKISSSFNNNDSLRNYQSQKRNPVEKIKGYTRNAAEWIKTTRLKLTPERKLEKILTPEELKKLHEKPIYLPNAVGKLGKVVGDYVGLPEQKLFLATTALCFQPLIDLKYAEEDKKIDVAIKSASKAIAGACTGIPIRIIAQKLAQKYIGYDETGLSKNNTINRYLFPNASLKGIENKLERAVKVKKYCNTIGNIAGILVMSFITNPLCDVPLTSDLQDVIGGVVKEEKTWVRSLSDVKNQRIDKIKKWFSSVYSKLLKTKGKLSRIKKIINEDKQSASSKKKEGAK